MPRVAFAIVGPGAILVASFCIAPRAVGAVNPSVCLVVDEGCLAPGGIRVRLVLGPGDTPILGGQLAVQYDPLSLKLISAAPGRTCDSASPFALEVFESVDANAGHALYAVGVNFLEGRDGSTGPATLACLSFAPTDVAVLPSQLCLLERLGEFSALLVDNTGHPISVDNTEDCPPDAPPPALSCDDVTVGVHCNCVPNTADCHGLDTPCRTGVCNPTTAQCEVASVNEDGPCDDGDPCTLVDRCREGTCVGAGCRNPSLCLDSTSCLALDPFLTVKVRLSEGDRVIDGAQFSVQYDPAELAFLGASPGNNCDGASPFVFEIVERVNEAVGQIFYAVGVAPGGLPGTMGPSTLACLSFLDLGDPGGDVCLFHDRNPFLTVLVDEFGQAVNISASQECPTDREPPVFACVTFETCRIPTLSDWGLVVMTLLLLSAAKIRFGRTFHPRRPTTVR